MRSSIKNLIAKDLRTASDLARRANIKVQRATKKMAKIDGGGAPRYPYMMVEDLFFEEGVQTEVQASFLTAGADFFVTSVAVYPFFRLKEINDTVADPSEKNYRPCCLSSSDGMSTNRPLMDAPLLMDLKVGFFENVVIKGKSIQRALQNGAIPSKLMFCDAVNRRPNRSTGGLSDRQYVNSFEHGNGLQTVTPWYLPKDSSVTVKVSPLFAQLFRDPQLYADWGTPTKKVEYKVAVVLDGFKREA